jgi:hypothetical protein
MTIIDEDECNTFDQESHYMICDAPACQGAKAKSGATLQPNEHFHKQRDLCTFI